MIGYSMALLMLGNRLIYLLLVLLLFAACTPQPGSVPNTGRGQTPEAESILADTRWVLVSYGEPGMETIVIEHSTITLEFASSGQAGGSGGCNSYCAQYVLQGDTLSFEQIVSTLIACEQEGVGQQEQRYFQALDTSGNFELAGNRLTVWYEGGQGKLNFVRKE